MVHLFSRRDRQKAQQVQQVQQTQEEKARKATQLLPETVLTQAPLPSGIPPEGRVVVTITRQFGSGGAEIAHMVAQESGLQYVDQGIIDEVAKRLGVSAQQAARQGEQVTGAVGHVLEAMRWSNPLSGNYSSLLRAHEVPAQYREQVFLRLTQRVILEMATEGNVVILDRGSQFLLHGLPRTLHVYVFVPRPLRIENVIKRFHLNNAQATDLIDRRDYEYDTYASHYYNADRQRPDYYHLLINTGLFPFDLAASLIRQALPLAGEISGSVSVAGEK